MNADVMAHLDYFSAQPPCCAWPECSDSRCSFVECRVHLAIVEINASACKASDAIKSMHHITKPARRVLAEYTADGFGEAAAEYGADFDTKKFVRHCGVKPRAEVRS